MSRGDLVVFALNASKDFGEAVASRLGIPLAAHEERDFEDGEHKARPIDTVRGKDVFVIQSLYADDRRSVNDKLCRFLFFLGAIKDASANRVTAVIPYLCYARKDRQSKPHDPITTRYVAVLFESIGVDHVIVMDVHNIAAFQNAWRIPADHLPARNLFVESIVRLDRPAGLVVVSPDAGAIKRAEEFRQALRAALAGPVQSAFVEKYRSDDLITGSGFAGNVAGKIAIIIDDIISSGTTVARAAQFCRDGGAVAVYAAASHGVFAGKATEVLSSAPLEKIFVTNTVAPLRLTAEFIRDKLVAVDAAPVFAEAIKRIHAGESLEELGL
jgi:ribose-phosphate pyrophosphokinase